MPNPDVPAAATGLPIALAALAAEVTLIGDLAAELVSHLERLHAADAAEARR